MSFVKTQVLPEEVDSRIQFGQASIPISLPPILDLGKGFE
jgi:hypothetical protein